MATGKLKTGYENRFAATIRDAIGASPTEDVEVVTPQFERGRDQPVPQSPPVDIGEWEALRSLPKNTLKELGCACWDGRLMLFPSEWYGHIPQGFVVENIFGDTKPFVPGETDDDIRFGCLSYGVPAVDGEIDGELE